MVICCNKVLPEIINRFILAKNILNFPRISIVIRLIAIRNVFVRWMMKTFDEVSLNNKLIRCGCMKAALLKDTHDLELIILQASTSLFDSDSE